MSKLYGVKRVTVRHKKRLVMIEASDTTPSPKELWETAESLAIGPIELATPAGVYTSKPGT
ncbi:MAG: hypothetical protein SGJ20_19780 [Planctomycetota bacterium]|nr:hypothetical protein [Planctomycetota bacterium]